MPSDILKLLAEDARRLRISRKLPPVNQPIPYDLVALVQEDFERFLTVTGLSLTDVARRMGRGYSGPTLSIWRSFDPDGDREFRGDLDRITRGLNEFMEQATAQALAPKPEGFVETTIAKGILTIIRRAIELRSMATVTSDSGRGKTMTFEAAAGVFPGAIMIRAKRRFRTSSGVARLIAHELRIARPPRNAGDLQLKLIDTLRDTGRLLIVDEAHQLTSDALEFIRDLHDECEMPIVLGGTRRLGDKTDDQDVFFGQFASRIALNYDANDYIRNGGGEPTQPLHTIEDIRAIFHSDTIRLTTDAEATLNRLANIEGYGGLRLCVQVVRVAAITAEKRQMVAIDAKLLLQVLREMHGKSRAVKRIERAMAQKPAKAIAG